MDSPSLVDLKALIDEVTKNVPLPWVAKDGDGSYDEAWCPWHDLGPLSLPGNTASKAEMAMLGALNALPSLLARIEALEAALKPFAEQRTIDEIMTAKNEPPEWASATVERRIEMIGERKRQGTDNILRARAALQKDHPHG